MTIIESRPDDLIRINLEFFRPFAATNRGEFTFRPEGDQTAVTWSMTGKSNFIAKAVHFLSKWTRWSAVSLSRDWRIGNQLSKAAPSIAR
jgi:hypothetical protein